MQILFAISVLCCIALILAAAAATRHIRVSRAEKGLLTEPSRGAEDLTSGRRHLTSRHSRPAPSQTMRQILGDKSWNQPLASVTKHPGPSTRLFQSTQYDIRGQRKSSQASPRGNRPDWAHFNKDLGDLSDPYEASRLRASSERSATSTKRR